MKSFIQFLKESYQKQMLMEGKHWPEDYIKTAINSMQNINIPQYNKEYAAEKIADAFTPLTHKNSNLGYYMPIVKWFIEYFNKRNNILNFLNTVVPQIIKTLLYISNNPEEESKIKNDIKTKWTLEDFEKYQKQKKDEIVKHQAELAKNFKTKDNGYTLVPIYSYKELNKRYGGTKTGDGENPNTGWCHTNIPEVYSGQNWTDIDKNTFFVLEKKGWENIKPPQQRNNAYDEYGLSLIAILVGIESNELIKSTLRWNHVVEPSLTKPGTPVDYAFIGWADLNEVVGFNVEAATKAKMIEKKLELEKIKTNANQLAAEELKSLTTIDRNTLVKYEDYITDIEIPSNIETIDEFAFGYYQNLKTVKIQEGVKRIGRYAFTGCKNLKSINIPSSLKIIELGVFKDCENLTEIINFSNLTAVYNKILASTFTNTNLKNIEIPDNVKKIGHQAFAHCKNLKSVKLPENLKEIMSGAFKNCINLKSINIPKNIVIDDFAFYNCKNLESLSLKDISNETIGKGTFCDCINLKSIELPQKLKFIGFDAFAGDKSLLSIEIPKTVENIANYSFYGCTSLKSITIPKRFENRISYIFDGVNLENVNIKYI